LKKNVHAPDDLIMVDRVYFGSSYLIFIMFLINTFSYQSTSGIQGGAYEGKGVEQIKDIVETMRASGENP
jgi:hypothetical protein